MQSFKDTKGRKWTLAITVASVKRVKGATGTDLYALADDGLKPLGELLGDVVRLVDVIYLLARDDKGNPPASEEDFAEALSGDVLGQAADAFVEALIDFFPKARAREALRKVTEKSKQVTEEVARLGMEELEALDPAKFAAALVAGAKSSGTSPAASASIPAA